MTLVKRLTRCRWMEREWWRLSNAVNWSIAYQWIDAWQTSTAVVWLYLVESDRSSSRDDASGTQHWPLFSAQLRSCKTPYCESGARFTKYLTTILRLSYDNAKVTIDLRRTSNLQNILRMNARLFWVRFACKVVRSSESRFLSHYIKECISYNFVYLTLACVGEFCVVMKL